MFKELSLVRQLILSFVGIALAAAIMYVAVYLYKSKFKNEIVTEIKTVTQNSEVNAIEQANKIKQADRNISPNVVRSELQQRGEFRAATGNGSASTTRGEPTQRVPSSGKNIPFFGRHGRHAETGQHSKQNTPAKMPPRGLDPVWYVDWFETQEILNGVNPCSDCVAP